jgi:hypothetical protein
MKRLVLRVAVAGLAGSLGCSQSEGGSGSGRSPEQPQVQAVIVLLPDAGRSRDAGPGLPIGAPCARADGYQQAEPLIPPDASAPWGSAPTGIAENQLPPGVRYCIVTDAFPNGYYTSNCKTDADCPTGARCFGEFQCEAPCQSDNDCKAPTVCFPPANLRAAGGAPPICEMDPSKQSAQTPRVYPSLDASPD